MSHFIVSCAVFAVLSCFPYCYPDGDFTITYDPIVPLVGKERRRLEEAVVCSGWQAVEWTSLFHTCFFDRKVSDGGRDLDTIVDRILQHAEACLETSKKSCLVDKKGFRGIFGKVLEQMKDYSEMYLERIEHDRGKIKDLKCVEDILKIGTYEECMKDAVSIITTNEIDPMIVSPQNESQKKERENSISKGLECTNREMGEGGCSIEAMTSLNRMVRNILGATNPPEENVDQFVKRSDEEKPWAWYDYIIQPVISAWNWVKSLFG